MIIFDIDDTISPTRHIDDSIPHTKRRAGGFIISIPDFVLDFLRSRDDIALLSSWGECAADVPKAFGFSAKVLIMNGGESGILGKLAVVNKQEGVLAWVDDRITPSVSKKLEDSRTVSVRPVGGFVSKAQIRRLTKLVEAA